jgi:hypothetical protein
MLERHRLAPAQPHFRYLIEAKLSGKSRLLEMNGANSSQQMMTGCAIIVAITLQHIKLI